MANRETSWYPVPNAGDIAVLPGAVRTTVVGLQTVPVAPLTPTDQQVLTFIAADGEWEPSSLIEANKSIEVNGTVMSDDYLVSVNLVLGKAKSPMFVNGA